MNTISKLVALAPEQAAEALFTAHRDETSWLDAFSQSLDQRRAAASLSRVLAIWDMSQSEAARVFGVSRQAISKWLDQGAPAERAVVIAQLSAATDLLVRYIKRDRIPAVVRRPIGSTGGACLIDLAARGDPERLLQIAREMFRFERAQGQE